MLPPIKLPRISPSTVPNNGNMKVPKAAPAASNTLVNPKFIIVSPIIFPNLIKNISQLISPLQTLFNCHAVF